MQRIDINNVKPGTKINVDIFAESNAFIPLLRKGNILTKDVIDKFRANNITEIYVEDSKSMQGTITVEAKKSGQPNPWAVLNVPYIKKEALITPDLKNEALNLLRDMFYTFSRLDAEACKDVVNKLELYVNQLASCICLNRDAKINIHDLHSESEYIYHHSLGVTAVSIAIGHALGLDYNSLIMLAKCAMLHDIGKIAVPTDVINKAEKLTEAEFAVMKEHSFLGFKNLAEKKIGTELEREAILFHHERIDGTGYPYGLKGERISLTSRILAVADVFDAMTSGRPYRAGLSPAETAEYIMSSAGTAFDFAVVDAFVKKMEFYPVGCFLELSTGNIAMVMDIKNGLRPVVHVIETKSTVDLQSDRRYLNVVINRIIPPKEAMEAIRK